MSLAIAKEEPSLTKNAVFAAYPVGINVFFNIITYFICKVKQLKSALEATIFSHMSKVSREGSTRHFRDLPAIFYLYSRGVPLFKKWVLEVCKVWHMGDRSAFGKIGRHMEAARSRRNFPYGGLEQKFGLRRSSPGRSNVRVIFGKTSIRSQKRVFGRKNLLSLQVSKFGPIGA